MAKKLSNSDIGHWLPKTHTSKIKLSNILLYLLFDLSRYSIFRSRILRLICRIEGGTMWSAGYRHLMARYYGIIIGRYSYGDIWPSCIPPYTTIGNFCSVAEGIRIIRKNHPTRQLSQHPIFFNPSCGIVPQDPRPFKALEMGHDVWLGTNVMITPGCSRIGTGAIIGACSVLTKDIPEYCIYAGNPARFIRQRFDDTICAALTECRWWEYSISDLLPVFHLFLKEVTLESVQILNEHLTQHSSI